MRGDKPHLYAVAAEARKPAGKHRPQPQRSTDDLPEPQWYTIFGTSQRHLSTGGKIAREHWHRLLPQLRAQGHLAHIDAGVFEELCICVGRISECEREMTLKGLVVEGDRGPVKNPVATIASQYRSRLKICEEQLGIGIMNRLRLPPPAPESDGDDDLDTPAD